MNVRLSIDPFHQPTQEPNEKLLKSTADRGALPLFFYIQFPFANMREQPKPTSEIVSQAYFSEEVNVLEQAEEWVKVETIADSYQGWIQLDSLCQSQQVFPADRSSVIARVNRCMAHIYGVDNVIFGPLLTLPFDSQLEVLGKQEANSRWIKVSLVDKREAYIQQGDVSLNAEPLSKEQMCKLSLQFLGLPYTWGGRSSFGYDCSGFVQMLYRQMGVYLPRDTKDQIKWNGFSAIAIEEMHAGDLIFFGLAEDKIRHVGMCLGNNQFIHATTAENMPYIRLSNLLDSEWNGSGRLTFRAARKQN